MARIFVYDGRKFDDPDPKMSVDEVRQHFASYFPELSNADSKESKQGEDTIIEFKKRVGTKGKLRMPGASGPGIDPAVDTRPIELPSEPKDYGDDTICSVGYCARFRSGYQGDGDTCTYALRNGVCPICGGPTEKKYDFGKPIQREVHQHRGYVIGQYPIIIKLFPDRKGLNFFRWFWASTNLFQRVRIGTFKPCRLGYCTVDNSHYDGGDGWVMDMLHHGLCPHCGNPTAAKYGVR